MQTSRKVATIGIFSFFYPETIILQESDSLKMSTSSQKFYAVILKEIAFHLPDDDISCTYEKVCLFSVCKVSCFVFVKSEKHLITSYDFWPIT